MSTARQVKVGQTLMNLDQDGHWTITAIHKHADRDWSFFGLDRLTGQSHRFEINPDATVTLESWEDLKERRETTGIIAGIAVLRTVYSEDNLDGEPIDAEWRYASVDRDDVEDNDGDRVAAIVAILNQLGSYPIEASHSDYQTGAHESTWLVNETYSHPYKGEREEVHAWVYGIPQSERGAVFAKAIGK